MDDKITKFKVEAKSRMAPEYSLEAMEKEVAQRYENARTLEEAAQEERARARNIEKMLQDIRNSQVNEVTYVDVKHDN